MSGITSGVTKPGDDDGTSGTGEPPWWRARKQRPGREPLTRETIIDAAVRILDAEGVDALTVRRVSQELGTGPATLYWHIPSKSDLGEMVYDRVMGELDLPEPDPDNWEEQVREMARSSYRIMKSHNDVVRLSIGRPPFGPNMAATMEWMQNLLPAVGVPRPMAGYFGALLGQCIESAVIEEPTPNSPTLPSFYKFLANLPTDQFPQLVATAETLIDHQPNDFFELGLDLLIRGIRSFTPAGAPASAPDEGGGRSS